MLTVHGQHFFVDILCCHIFFPQKPHNTTLFYRGTRTQGCRHLVTATPSLQSCAYRSLHVTIKLDSAAIQRWQFPALNSKTWVTTWICNLLIDLHTYNTPRYATPHCVQQLLATEMWRLSAILDCGLSIKIDLLALSSLIMTC